MSDYDSKVAACAMNGMDDRLDEEVKQRVQTVDDILHSVIDVDQMMVMTAEALVLRPSAGGTSADDVVQVEKLERLMDLAMKNGKLLRKARRKLGLKYGVFQAEDR